MRLETIMTTIANVKLGGLDLMMGPATTLASILAALNETNIKWCPGAKLCLETYEDRCVICVYVGSEERLAAYSATWLPYYSIADVVPTMMQAIVEHLYAQLVHGTRTRKVGEA